MKKSLNKRLSQKSIFKKKKNLKNHEEIFSLKYSLRCEKNIYI